jgi:hypothetical protein
LVDEFFLAPGRAAAGEACYLTTSAGAANPLNEPLPPFFDRARRMR